MNYITIKEAALRWGIAERTVNKFCLHGRIEGAKKFGTTLTIVTEWLFQVVERTIVSISPRIIQIM